MQEENLHLLIHEDIYLIKEETAVTETTVSSSDQGQMENTLKPTIVNENLPESTDEKQGGVLETHDKLPFAIFHSSTNEDEIALLNKIIAACNVDEANYSVFNNGFDRSVNFRKALVFVDKAKAFYTPIPYKESEFLCSRPLSVLMTTQSEKALLWKAIQQFVLNLK